jgi:hypothetical protein
MGHLIYTNVIQDATISKTDLNNTINVTGGSYDNLKTRSPINNLILEGQGIGAQYRMTIGLSSSVTSRAICFLGCRGVNPSISLWTGVHGSGAVTFSETVISKTRYIDGEEYTDYLHIFEDDETFLTITWEVSIDLGTDYYGSVYIADDISNIDFDPMRTRINSVTTAFKDRSNGGQVYSTSGITYNTLTTQTVAQDKATTLEAVRDFNNNVGISEECFIVLEQADEMFFYGTQTKPAQVTPAPGKNSSGWYFTNAFQFEEEL